MNQNQKLKPSLQALATATYPLITYVLLLLPTLNCNQTETEKPISISTPVVTTPSKPIVSNVDPKKQVSPTPTTTDLDENEILIGNLVWENASVSGLISWTASKNYCKKIGMRLPKLKELKVNYRGLKGQDSVWSSDINEDPNFVWIIDLGKGGAETTSKDFLNEVRCVRNL